METGETTIFKKSYSAAEKLELVAQWKQSGKTMMAFSKTIGVNYHTFLNWIHPKKTKKTFNASIKKVSGFSEIELPSSAPGNLFARIELGKTKVDIYQPVSADFLKRLVNA